MARHSAGKSSEERNYLFLLLGGIFIIALLVILAFALAPAVSLLPIDGCVGVVKIEGPIVSQDIEATIFSDEVKGAESLAEEIRMANKREDVKSLLVVIDSPGGSVVGSKEIYDALFTLEKPSVAYINEMAASGGYYVASANDYIVSQPDAITGNIGARATFADMSGLFGKLGINETTIKTGAMKDLGSPSRPMTNDERAVLESIINESFRMFRSDVEQGRGDRLRREAFLEVLDARIVSGRQALKIGLVDELGNKKLALKKAAELGGIKSEEPSLCELSESKGGKGLFGSLSSQAIEFIAKGSGLPRLYFQ